MKAPEYFEKLEESLMARFKASGVIAHSGDKGEEREAIFREFLGERLPRRYGVIKGEMLTSGGEHSHAADVIVYDALNCPVIYRGNTAVLPIEGVYGIIEVKSRLSKAEFVDASRKIESFKRLAPRDLSIIRTRDHVTMHRPSRPFGFIFGFELGDNSLDSLVKNWNEENGRIYDVNFFTNLVAVLGSGILKMEEANLSLGEKHLLLETDRFVDLVMTQKIRSENKQELDEIVTRVCADSLGSQTLGRFLVYLLLLVSRMKLNVPDLGRYLDPTLPMMITRES